MQLICVDEQSFAEIRKRNGVYIDKTRMMYEILKSGKYFFISRPRRFGKSLLCSMLAALFSGKKELFKDLWIEQSDWEWRCHPVIHLDMTKAASAAYVATDVMAAVMLILRGIAENYGVLDINTQDPASYFGELLRKLHDKTGQQVVVIVDEYDKPLLDVITKSEQYKPIHNVLRSLYAQMKANSNHLRFVLLTGVFKFAQTSVFSGLNNLIDLTFSPAAAELLGYTEQEISDNFPQHLEALASKHSKSVEEMRQILKEQYNGYIFGVDPGVGTLSGSVYNPFGINHVFQQQMLVDQWFASATPTMLIEKLREMAFVGIDPSELTVNLGTLKDSCNPDGMTALLLLYYAGYVTIKAYNVNQKKVALDFPNAEVAQAFSRALLPEVSKKTLSSFGLITDQINNLLYEEKPEGLKDIFNQALAQLPYHMFGTQERYYQTVIYLLFNASSVVTVAEDMMNRGRADITVLLPKVIYIFELKMNQSASVALEQIKQRDYAAKYKHLGRKMYLIGVELSSEERVVKDLLIDLA